MVRTVGLWRAVVHRSRADWPVVAAAFVLLVGAIALLTTGALYGDTVALGGLRQAVEATPPADRAILVRTSGAPADIADLDGAVRAALDRALSASGGEVGLVVSSGSLAPVGLDTAAASGQLTVLASYQGIERHATLTGGRWAKAGRTPVEATLSDGAATALGLTIGGRIDLTRGLGGAQSLAVQIVGTWRPAPGDGYWLGDPLELTGIHRDAQRTTRGPFVIAPEDLATGQIDRALGLEWRGLVATDGLRVDRIDALRQGVVGLTPTLRAALPPPRQLSVQTDLPTILADASRAILVSRSEVALLTLQFAVVAGYAVLLVAGLLIERRRAEVALLRSRGATSVHLVALALGEAVLLAVPAAAVAPFLAVFVVRLVGSIGPLGDSGVIDTVGVNGATALVAALAAVAAVLVLTLPSVVSTGTPAGIRAALSRQVGRTMAQRLGIDLALVVLAAIALWQLRLYGAPITRNARGLLGLDPFLVAAPAIGLLAGAVLATRIVPRLAEVGERILERRRGIVPALSARQVARRPLRYTRSALLLVLAAALGTFAATSAATFARSQLDQAAYRAAGDARVVLTDYPQIPAWATGTAYRTVPGVIAATPVTSQSLDVGRTVRGGRLLAVDPTAVARTVSIPSDGPTPDLLDRLAGARPTTSAVAIAGRPQRLAITLSADLGVDPSASGDSPVPADWKAVAAALVVQDRDGRLHRLDAGEIGLQATDQRLEVALAETVDGVALAPTYPLRLVAVELAIAAPSGLLMIGHVELRSVAASPTGSGQAATDWTAVALDPAATGWLWTRTDAQASTVYHPPAGAPGRLDIGGTDASSGPLFGSFDQPGATYRLVATPSGDGALAAIAGDRLLDLTGAHVGDTIAVSSAAQTLTVRIVGRTTSFPPLDPTAPFLVVDGASLDQTEYSATAFPATTGEWWLTLDPARADAVATTIGGAPYPSAQIIRRTQLAEALANDPIRLGVVGVLGIGALAALVFATIGFLVSATVSTTERLGELALLRALGLSGRQLSTWLALEQVFLIGVGLVGGSLLGLILAWLVLPYTTLSVTGAAVVPTPVIVVPWGAVLPIDGIVAVLFVAAAWVLARQVPGRRVSQVLRAGGE